MGMSTTATRSRTWQRQDFLWLAVVGAAWLAATIAFLHRFYQLRGVPWAIVASMLSHGGQMLYRDIAASITPLSIYLQAFWFKLVPATVNANRWLGAVATLLAMIVAFALIRRLTDSGKRAALAGGFVLIWGASQLAIGLWGDTYYRFAELLSLVAVALLAWPHNGHWAAAVAAGIAGAAAYFTYQPAGGIIAIALLICWAAHLARACLPRWRLAGAGPYARFFTLAAGAFFVSLPLLYLLLVPAPARADFWLFTWKLPHLYATSYLQNWPHVLLASVPPLSPLAWPSYLNGLTWLLPGAFIVWLGLAWVVLQQPVGYKRAACEVLLACALAGLGPVIWHPAVARILVHVTIPLLLTCLVLLPERRTGSCPHWWTRVGAAALGLFVVAGAARALWCASWKSETFFSSPGGSLWMSRDDAEGLERTIPLLQAEAAINSGKVYLLGRGSQLFLFSGTQPALRYPFNVDALIGPEQFREQAGQIARECPARIFGVYTAPEEFYKQPYARALVEILRREYRSVASEAGGQAFYELLQRRDRATSRPRPQRPTTAIGR